MKDAAGDDETLVASALEGNDDAFETLVLRHRRAATSMARRYFPNLDDAEDLAQEALVRAYQNLHKLKPGVVFQYWLLRITVNLCLDRFRREKRRRESLLSQMSPEGTAWLDRQLLAPSVDKHRNLERSREAQDILTLVLPLIAPRDRAVLHLLYTEERDVAEVARILGWSRSNVKVRAFRARRVLRKAIEELQTPPPEGKGEKML